jgi:hypothetical protein
LRRGFVVLRVEPKLSFSTAVRRALPLPNVAADSAAWAVDRVSVQAL